MNTETGTRHPYPFDAEAFAIGERHGKIGRYSLSASTGPGWVYWYGVGRSTTQTDK